MERIKVWLSRANSPIYIVAVALVAFIIAALAYGCTHKPETVTQETQTQAETPAGVEDAADQARVPVDHEQAKDAAKEIRYIYQHDTKPVYTVITTAKDTPKQAETAREAAGADFSIITSKTTPDKKVDVKKLPENTPVELNQYNVQAYKKVLHTVEVSPDIDEGGAGISEVGYTLQRKITKDGKYIGVGAAYNADQKKAYAKITYTW